MHIYTDMGKICIKAIPENLYHVKVNAFKKYS